MSSHPTAEAAHDDHEAAHLATYFRVFWALIGLLVVTIGVAYIDFGPLALAVALGVATLKAGLIMIYFMHLRDATALVQVYSVSGFVSLSILLTILFADYLSRGAVTGW